jgi:toxin-antitoxin system PIN domain toxin
VILLDVNILVHACRRDAERHAEFHAWLVEQLSGEEPVGIYPESLASVVRITTHPRVWKHPLAIDDALTFAEAVRASPASVVVQPGDNHWSLFTELCRAGRVKGNLAMDAWLAALAIESGCTLITTDTDFARFRGLRWRMPF